MHSSLFDKLLASQVCDYPYPHLIIDDFLPTKVYEELEHVFDLPIFDSNGTQARSNELLLSSAFEVDGRVKTLLSELLTPEAQEVLSFFRNKEAWGAILRLFDMATPHEWGLSWRGNYASELHARDASAGYVYEVQFGVNTPVTKNPSRVRGIHIDQPQKMFNGLIYFRSQEDKCSGGDLGLYRFRKAPKLYNTSALDLDCELSKVIPYRRNTFVLLSNTVASLHGVIERSVCSYYRRYININLAAHEKIIPIEKYQASKFRHQYLYTRLRNL